MPPKLPKTEPTAMNIIKTGKILSFDESQTLSKVLYYLKSSHDAAFIFDNKNNFKGVINPFYLFKNRSLTVESKISTALIMPPKISPTTNLPQIARLMLESKIYFLPVIDQKENFLGIVTINRLLDYIIKLKLLNDSTLIIFHERPIITGRANMMVSQALKLMRNEKISKLPIVDENNVLTGIVTQNDLKEFVDQRTSHLRFDRIGTKQADNDTPIRDYVKKFVISIDHIPKFNEAVNLMNHHNIGSLVITDKNQHPLDIITKEELLRTIADFESL